MDQPGFVEPISRTRSLIMMLAAGRVVMATANAVKLLFDLPPEATALVLGTLLASSVAFAPAEAWWRRMLAWLLASIAVFLLAAGANTVALAARQNTLPASPSTVSNLVGTGNQTTAFFSSWFDRGIDVGRLQRQIEALDEQNRTLADQNRFLNQSNRALEQQLASLQDELTESGQLVQSLSNQIVTLEAVNQELVTELNDMSTTFATARQNLVDLQTQSRAEIQRLSEENSQLAGETRRLEEQVRIWQDFWEEVQLISPDLEPPAALGTDR